MILATDLCVRGRAAEALVLEGFDSLRTLLLVMSAEVSGEGITNGPAKSVLSGSTPPADSLGLSVTVSTGAFLPLERFDSAPNLCPVQRILALGLRNPMGRFDSFTGYLELSVTVARRTQKA